MVGADFHAAVQVESVGCETLNAGIEGKVFTAFFPGVLDQPIEERSAEAAGTIGLVGNEVVDVEGPPGEEEIKDPKAGDGANRAIELQISEVISFFLLLEDTGGEIDRLNVGP
jgi:hypothetical protein